MIHVLVRDAFYEDPESSELNRTPGPGYCLL
jgi:hypothetical protein